MKKKTAATKGGKTRPSVRKGMQKAKQKVSKKK